MRKYLVALLVLCSLSGCATMEPNDLVELVRAGGQIYTDIRQSRNGYPSSPYDFAGDGMNVSRADVARPVVFN